jgi:hypothetical protein
MRLTRTDADEQLGQPIASNVLPLTKIHHAALPHQGRVGKIKNRLFKMKSIVCQPIH